jgi:4-aminobutyrate aminotransferase-like enzyme
LANFEEMERMQLVQRAEVMGDWLQSKIFPLLFSDYEINGKGMIWAIDLKDIEWGRRVVAECTKNGLILVSTHAGTIKIVPPLIISKKEFLRGLTILKNAIEKTKKE